MLTSDPDREAPHALGSGLARVPAVLRTGPALARQPEQRLLQTRTRTSSRCRRGAAADSARCRQRPLPTPWSHVACTTLSLTSSRFPLARTTVASPHAVRVAHFLTSFCLVNWAAPPASKAMPGTEKELNKYLLFKCLRINRFINK